MGAFAKCSAAAGPLVNSLPRHPAMPGTSSSPLERNAYTCESDRLICCRSYGVWAGIRSLGGLGGSRAAPGALHASLLAMLYSVSEHSLRVIAVILPDYGAVTRLLQYSVCMCSCLSDKKK